MTTNTIPETTRRFPTMKELRPLIEPFARSQTKTAVWQLLNSVVPYIALWAAMAYSLRYSYWITLGLAVLAGGFLIRIFIIFHDCGHNSFFPSTRANRIVGFWLGVLVFTPSEHWWHAHAVHHATSGNLDKRGVGDVTTWTVDEYKQARGLKKLAYWIERSPIGMLLFGPVYMFLITHRFSYHYFGKREQHNVWLTNLAIVGMVAGISLLIGFKEYWLIQLPVTWVSGFVGIYLFYVQHQFDGMYWVRSKEWDYVASALKGASYMHLPRLLQWFTGNIGFHHIHHLSPRIPNYMLDKAHAAVPALREGIRTLTIGSSIRCLRYNLWDEQHGRLVSFQEARSL